AGLALAPQARAIFVNGVAGTIGSALTELAKAKGLGVIGTVSSEQKARYAKAKGADEVVFYQREPVLERVMAATEGRGVDAAFDHVIGAGFIDCVRMLADFGTAVAYNVHTPMPGDDVFAELRRLSIRSPGVRVFNIHTYDHDIPLLRKLTQDLIKMLAAGLIKPTIGARLPLTRIAEAHRMFEEGSTLGKIVLLP
ncbi:MAG: zinc-binding dehydrogenase, partial [Bradyrhizobium sp.]|uniref:quinone oxidoreductase family protein n=1 Tax=Bradyrhizobium sp. TaxID=376 RepID=UPI001D3EBEC4